jgi:hypothetical protein
MWIILRGSKSGIAWLTGQIPLHAPQEKQRFRYSPPGISVTSALKAALISLLVIPILSSLIIYHQVRAALPLLRQQEGDANQNNMICQYSETGEFKIITLLWVVIRKTRAQIVLL